MNEELFVLVLAAIAGVIAGYSDDLFRAIVAAGVVWIHHDVLRK